MASQKTTDKRNVNEYIVLNEIKTKISDREETDSKINDSIKDGNVNNRMNPLGEPENHFTVNDSSKDIYDIISETHHRSNEQELKQKGLNNDGNEDNSGNTSRESSKFDSINVEESENHTYSNDIYPEEERNYNTLGISLKFLSSKWKIVVLIVLILVFTTVAGIVLVLSRNSNIDQIRTEEIMVCPAEEVCPAQEDVKMSYNSVLHQVKNAKEKEMFPVKNSARRMAFICGDIWIIISLNRRILILQNGTHVRTVFYRNIEPRSIYYYNNDNIILASHKGLHVLNTSAVIQYTIYNGIVGDIAGENTTIVANRKVDDEYSIIIFEYELNNYKWNAKSKFLARKISGILMDDTLLLFESVIYILDFQVSKIIMYQKNGNYLKTLQLPKESVRKSYFFLCGIDVNKNILIAVISPQRKDRLLVLSPTGHFNNYYLENLYRPKHVLVEKNYDVWVLQYPANFCKVSRYSP